MHSTESLKEAERVMVICNACRYCEGFCAVFQAMERRRSFSAHDLTFLAHLCHDCRACYYACQYAPPHEFDLNVPKTFQELRVETYRDWVWRGLFATLFQRNGFKVASITVLTVTIVVLLVLLRGASVVFASHLGEGAFYAVIPRASMVLPASLIALGSLVILLLGTVRFWRYSCTKSGKLIGSRALKQATGDVLRLRYLDGAGHGCNYPGERFSHTRRWLHHLAFYGFMLCLAATTLAAIYEHLLHRLAPYPFWSPSVVLGTAGGVALLVGSGGLFWLKRKSDPSPTNKHFHGMDLAFSMLLFLTSLTGLLLLGLRGTRAMGMLLAIHLGLVLGLFLTLPYGKFVHALYRYTALMINAVEQWHEES